MIKENKDGDAFAELRDWKTDTAMKDYSIDPKFRYAAYWIVNSDASNFATPHEKDTMWRIWFPTDPQFYLEDRECGEKLHKYFGNTIYEGIKDRAGEESAQKIHQGIKDALYGN